MSPRDTSATWLDEEAPLGSTFVVLIARLLRRGMVSWFLWAPLITAVIAMSAVRSARRVSYDATVVLGATEGNVRTAAEELTSSALRSYVREWAFTGDHLVELMKRYPRDFSDLATDPGEAVESMRKGIDVTVSDIALLEDRLPDDPPRTARIGITYTAGTPEQALTMARELANVVVTSTLRRENVAAERDAAAAAALLENPRRCSTRRPTRARPPRRAIRSAKRCARKPVPRRPVRICGRRLRPPPTRASRPAPTRRTRACASTWSTPDGCRPGEPGSTWCGMSRGCCCWPCSRPAFCGARSIRGSSIAET